MRTLRKILLATAVGLLVLEVVLQLAAVVAAWTMAGPTTAPGDGSPILCIGDSYTYGLGATTTEHSYPDELQRLLRAADPMAPAVVNAGWPGQNSREALLRLDAQLDRYRPRLVCVLIGLNDSWTRPEPLEESELAAADPPGFQWRFRTLRLLRLLFAPTPPSPEAAPRTPPEDSTGDEEARGVDDGFAARAAALVQQGHPEEAVTLLVRALVEDPANAPEYHQGLVQIRTALGHRDLAAGSLQWLRERYALTPDRATAEALASALLASGARAEAGAIASAAVEQHAKSSTLWWVAGTHHEASGDHAAAERAFETALTCADPDNRAWAAIVHRDLAAACCGRDVGKAIRSMLSAMRIDRDVERCRLVVDGHPEAFGRGAIAAALQGLELDATGRELLQRLFGETWGERATMCDVLRGHLRRIIERCRMRGCGVVLLGYPLPVTDIEAVQREAATEFGLPYVSCMPTFGRALQSRPRAELYVTDGHCTDAGYALMAQTVLPAVVAALGR